MKYLFIFNVISSTLFLYYYIYSSIGVMAELVPYKRNARSAMILSVILNSLISAWVRINNIDSYVAYLLIFLIMLLTFYLCLKTDWQVVFFAATRFVFYLFTARGFVISLYSLIMHQPIRDIKGYSFEYSIIYLLSIILALLIHAYLKRNVLIKSRLQVLFRNKEQVLFTASIKFVLGLYLMILTYGNHYEGNDVWFSLIQLLSCFIVTGIAAFVLENSIRSAEIVEHERQTISLQKQVDMQVNHYHAYQEFTSQFQEFKKEYLENLSKVNELLRKNDTDSVIKILDTMGSSLTRRVGAHHQYSNNPFLDALFQEFANQCRRNDIEFECRVYWDKEINISELELVRIFSNLLQNAFEAVEKLSDHRNININTQVLDEWIVVVIENNFELKEETNNLAKGLGMQVVSKTMEDIGGLYTWSTKENTFRVYLNFPKNN
ncbi:sensor histidine kinase [Erysipelothrix inopinata]|uniref:Sensor histidine kinase n=1 Tax=Erysipelothrix inopinata TaxID=225084 RepID=A0A7G9RWD1_9FIRM|nr:GHKL domain-containing protein [Erysipelothrix inopinata]QNN59906.1 sensor histidine kinase [Erysipelothrix inopinata]